MAIEYAPLFALETQFQSKDGRNNTGGWLKVFLAATDDPAATYSDYNGTRNPEKIVLDDDGRAIVICDKSKAYRLEVYSVDGSLLWTEEPVYCSGTGGGGVSITKVVSTDGSISVDANVAGSTTTYDIGLAPSSSDEFLEWIRCSEEDCGTMWYPVFQDGTMETEAGQGVKVHGGHLYHFTNSFIVDPDGTGVNYDTFRVIMYCGDVEVDMREFEIDSSLNDQVLCEFSRDVVPTEDSHVYFKLTIPSTCEVTGETQCHRIYSGINAVPDTCATKQWVQETFDYNLSSKVDYSAIGYNGQGQISGISGSAIAGGLDSASVSSIASSVASAYTESAFSSISSWSADFSSISSKADQSALSAYQPVSAMSAYATTAYVVSAVSGKLDTSAFASASAGFAPTGDYAYNSSLSAYYPASASGAFQPSGNYQTAGDYAFNSAVSSKLDASASGNFVANSAMSSWIPYSALDYSGTAISGIGGSSLAGMGGNYTGIYPVNVDNDTREIAVDSMPLVTDSSMTSYVSAGSSVIGVNLDIMSGKQDASAMTAYQPSGDYAYNSALSSKLDASASSLFQPSGNYQTAGDYAFNSALSAYQPVSGMSAYQPSGDYAFNSALGLKQDASAMTAYQLSGDYYSASNPSGFITGVDLTPYQTTADMSAYQTTAGMTAYQPVGAYIYESALGWAEV